MNSMPIREKISARLTVLTAAYAVLLAMALCTVPACSKGPSPNSKDKPSAALQQSDTSRLRIAISKHYDNYSRWLLEADKDIVWFDMYTIPLDSALKIVGSCDGLLLTGGPDVEPGRYDKPGDTARCEIDHRRDTLEFALIDAARKLRMPVFGICRGEQLLNVYYGGTLIVDIPEDYKTEIQHKCKKPDTCFHDVAIEPGTLLESIVQVTKGVSNTNHHQCVKDIAKGFVVASRSSDGVIEAIEWAGGEPPAGEPFVLAVQWHPERLDHGNPLSLLPAKYFIGKALEFKRGRLKR